MGLKTACHEPHLQANLKTDFYMSANKFLIIARTAEFLDQRYRTVTLKQMAHFIKGKKGVIQP